MAQPSNIFFLTDNERSRLVKNLKKTYNTNKIRRIKKKLTIKKKKELYTKHELDDVINSKFSEIIQTIKKNI